MANKVQVFVDREPLREAKVGKRYETVAGNDVCVSFADDEDADFVGNSLSSFLELWIICENWHNL